MRGDAVGFVRFGDTRKEDGAEIRSLDLATIGWWEPTREGCEARLKREAELKQRANAINEEHGLFAGGIEQPE